MSPFSKYIKGFSKLTKEEKRKIVSDLIFKKEDFNRDIKNMDHPVSEIQELLDQISENTIGNFHFPFGVAPNFLVNDRYYMVPMVSEESSVVAASSSAAGFWAKNGGFKSIVLGTVKIGQIHFIWQGTKESLHELMPEIKEILLVNTLGITERMRERGGGISEIELVDFSGELEGYYQLKISFETADSMGANFINTCLEEMANVLKGYMYEKLALAKDDFEIIMSILSNYTPDCLVDCYAEAPVTAFDNLQEGLSASEFTAKFQKAVQIANIDKYRAVTHNKGIFNGIDAVAIATGNDFRAVEAAGHAYASRNGKYESLSYCYIKNGLFRFGLILPLAIGSVGGLTRLHPMAKWSFEILGNPDSRELMSIMAAAGLANNFAAVKSLITSGIQEGHMKLHLSNLLYSLNATESQRNKAFEHFANRKVSYELLRKFISG
jgi:hydroxymethylglutaryl-CoA reductase